ncbi:hypothetical protein OG730_05090 [Streptomyces sp. NBC_01298]|uniref:hypothetical protein n=1 Tax=Streptomyces sp. NBC_01298 TaxID=2903817 RepID=UPI002E13D53B|nr:hypothetical protein OG730_05090 [Streptomyces sp. NBC_01298]
MSTDTAPRLSLVDLYILGDLIAARLGDTWTKSDDTTDTEAISFDHTAGHTISVRRLWDGVGAQTSLHMEGQPTYNAGAVFSDSEATSDTLLKAIESRLLPALGGHRPKLQQSGTPHPPPDADTAKLTDQAPAGSEPAQDTPTVSETAEPSDPPTHITPTAPAATKPPAKAKKAPAARPKKATTAAKTTTVGRTAKATGATKRATTRTTTTTSA